MTGTRSERDYYYRDLIQLTPCEACAHLIKIRTPQTSTCRAFPQGIPYPIIAGEWDHSRAGFPCDHGLRFKPYKKEYLDGVHYLVGWNGVLIADPDFE